MSRHVKTIWNLLATLGVLCVSGCTPTKPFYFHDDGDMSHYKDKATEIEYPDANVHSLTEVANTQPPMTADRIESLTPWPLTLEEAVQIALANSKIIRRISNVGQGMNGTGAADTLISSGSNGSNSYNAPATVYNPALTESDPTFGVEGALAAFDATWQNSMLWQKFDRPQNIGGFVGNAVFVRVLEQDLGTFNSTLAKTTATGAQFAFSNQTIYTANNNPTNGVPSAYFTQMQGQWTQPLLRGAGTQFNRIAGPGAALTNGFGVFRGVVIARINTDQALADFEGNVQNQVNDIERVYRELYYLYRQLDANKAGRDSALKTWQNLDEKFRVSIKGGEKLFVAKARFQYYQLRAQAEQTLWDLLALETRLRYLMGLAPTDGRIIRPIDEPTTAKIEYDWCELQNEALLRQVGLRRQRWQIKKSEMELIAARNFLLPQLDAVARYRFVGLGDDLMGTGGPDLGALAGQPGQLRGSNAFATLGTGRFQEWEMGLTFNVNLGFRRELAAVRNKQLQLARERSILQEQELEVTHLLSDAMRNVYRSYALLQTGYNQRLAAKEEEETAQLAVESETPIVEGVNPIDQLLEAQQRRVTAEIAYYRYLVDYNEAILAVHHRKGSILEYNNVYLAEGPWPCKAYFDARKRARERDAGNYIDYGFTRPQVISRGPYQQFQGPSELHQEGPDGEWQEGLPTPAYDAEEEFNGQPEMLEAPLTSAVDDGRTTATPTSSRGDEGVIRAVFEQRPSVHRDEPFPAQPLAGTDRRAADRR